MKSKTLVKIIGSKKKPILPINLEETVGKDIFNIALVVDKSGFKSFLLIVNFLGRNTRNVKIEASSVPILIRIKPITDSVIPLDTKDGINK